MSTLCGLVSMLPRCRSRKANLDRSPGWDHEFSNERLYRTQYTHAHKWPAAMTPYTGTVAMASCGVSAVTTA